MNWIDNSFNSEKTKIEIIQIFIRFLKDEGVYTSYKRFFYSDRNYVRKIWIKSKYLEDFGMISFLIKYNSWDFVMLARNYDYSINWDFWNGFRDKWYDLLYTHICF